MPPITAGAAGPYLQRSLLAMPPWQLRMRKFVPAIFAAVSFEEPWGGAQSPNLLGCC